MKLTKLDMAKVITTAVFNMKELAPDNHHHVKRLVKMKKIDLKDNYELALEILKEGMKK